jgi:hypothetical protein
VFAKLAAELGVEGPLLEPEQTDEEVAEAEVEGTETAGAIGRKAWEDVVAFELDTLRAAGRDAGLTGVVEWFDVGRRAPAVRGPRERARGASCRGWSRSVHIPLRTAVHISVGADLWGRGRTMADITSVGGSGANAWRRNFRCRRAPRFGASPRR